jgi:proline dehydrogenase
MDLSNTEIAFKIQTNRDLKNGLFLFSLIKHPFVVRTLGGISSLALKIGFPISWAVKPTLYRHFVGGETLDECLPAARKMWTEKVASILDFSVESAESETDIVATTQEILCSIENSGKYEYVPFSVFKPTALAFPEILKKASCDKNSLTGSDKESFDAFVQRIDTLCAAAEKAGKPVMIDAEDYWYQPVIDEITEQMMIKYNKNLPVVYATLQMYRHDRLDYLNKLIELSKKENFIIGVKYVRGAYMEKERARAAAGGYPSPIYPTKQDTDNAFNEALRRSVENIERMHVFCGTHNEESILKLVQYMKDKGLPNNYHGIYFSQLYGMSDNLSFNLAAEGYNAAKYLPYGKIRNVLPYLIRRAEENSAIAGQTTRELIMIREELKRRKSK